ncbi:hypothetical protein [Bradyrhizobium sp. STM 3809]|uniref:hypothetical protein n=1 Tax=Bradyrhizobium sp. STM 3809 TaxID=551936 RepID=UPI00024097B8|nr:hypothetical protein [Bradyrhizobium sp. STM 3809]CCE01221.1 conserved exported hypothetical protein [Bradyrhizobium sp. STM 3809]
MSTLRGRRAIAGAMTATLLIMLAPAATLAQSGSAGGSIGNDDKSLSGARSEPRSVERERPSPRRSEPSRARSSGGGASFDGAWVVTSTGGPACPGSVTSAAVVTSGKVIGQGFSGSISSNGVVNTVGNDNGVRVVSTGRVSGRSGSGSFQRSDGCSGRWTSVKQ